MDLLPCHFLYFVKILCFGENVGTTVVPLQQFQRNKTGRIVVRNGRILPDHLLQLQHRGLCFLPIVDMHVTNGRVLTLINPDHMVEEAVHSLSLVRDGGDQPDPQ